MFGWIKRKNKLSKEEVEQLNIEKSRSEQTMIESISNLYGSDISIEEGIERMTYDIEHFENMTLGEMLIIAEIKICADKINQINNKLGVK